MVSEFVPALIVLVGGLVLLLVLVAVLLGPPLRRFAQARAALRDDVAEQSDRLRALAAARRQPPVRAAVGGPEAGDRAPAAKDQQLSRR